MKFNLLSLGTKPSKKEFNYPSVRVSVKSADNSIRSGSALFNKHAIQILEISSPEQFKKKLTKTGVLKIPKEYGEKLFEVLRIDQHIYTLLLKRVSQM